MEFLDHPFWRNTNGRNEQCCFFTDYDINELCEFPFGVIVLQRADRAFVKLLMNDVDFRKLTFVFLAFPPT